jgi:cystathionine gamma-synthase
VKKKKVPKLKRVQLIHFDIHFHLVGTERIVVEKKPNHTKTTTKMAVSSFHRVFTFECRSDPDFSSLPSTENLRNTRRHFPAAGLSVAFYGVSSPILRFPPNFQRQLSTKARRNCSNIGVAQIVAASWSNEGTGNPAAGAPPVPAVASAVDAATAPLPLDLDAADDKNVAAVENGAVQTNRSSYSSFLKSDASKTIHAGM